MRLKERIPIFLKLVDSDYLTKRWNLPKDLKQFLKNHIKHKEILPYWVDNYNQRFGQVLINLGLLPDNFNIWIDEEQDILIDQGVEPREFLFWGSIYDKNNNLLEETKFTLIKDLETNHIVNILNMFKTKGKLSPLYKEIFLKELEMRIENPFNLGEI